MVYPTPFASQRSPTSIGLQQSPVMQGSRQSSRPKAVATRKPAQRPPWQRSQRSARILVYPHDCATSAPILAHSTKWPISALQPAITAGIRARPREMTFDRCSTNLLNAILAVILQTPDVLAPRHDRIYRKRSVAACNDFLTIFQLRPAIYVKTTNHLALGRPITESARNQRCIPQRCTVRSSIARKITDSTNRPISITASSPEKTRAVSSSERASKIYLRKVLPDRQFTFSTPALSITSFQRLISHQRA
jgi:hypothetical protein